MNYSIVSDEITTKRHRNNGLNSEEPALGLFELRSGDSAAGTAADWQALDEKMLALVKFRYAEGDISHIPDI